MQGLRTGQTAIKEGSCASGSASVQACASPAGKRRSDPDPDCGRLAAAAVWIRVAAGKAGRMLPIARYPSYPYAIPGALRASCGVLFGCSG